MNYYDYYFNLLTNFFPASIVHFRTYRVKRRAALRRKEAKRFLQSCLREKILPKSMIPKAYNNYKLEPFPQIYHLLLSNRIASLPREINYLFKICKMHYHILQELLPTQIFRSSVGAVNFTLNRNIYSYKQRLNNKLTKICKDSLWNQFSNSDLVVNLSEYRLTDCEVEVLGLGLGFSMGPSKNSKLHIISSFNQNKAVI